jgi:hypothetical protein
MTTFLLTFETITPESAEQGDVAEHGVLYEAITLREALEQLEGAETIEANEYPLQCPRWVTGYGTHEDYLSGEVGNISLHFPEHLTPSTRRRIVRLLEAQL